MKKPLKIKAWFEGLKAELDRLADENAKLRQVIDAAAQSWLALNPGIVWEGGLDAAMRAAVAEIERLRARKDAAFRERNEVVSLLARLFPAGVAKTDVSGWNAEWHGCVYIDTPCGQLSWHFHDSHAPMFAGLPPYSHVYDGHTTEKKYARVAELRETLSAAAIRARKDET